MDFFDTLNSWNEFSLFPSMRGKIQRRRVLESSNYDHYVGMDDERRYMYMLKLTAKPNINREYPSINGCIVTLEPIEQVWHFCMRLKNSGEWPYFKLTCQVLIQTLEERFSVNAEDTLIQVARILKKCNTFFKSPPVGLSNSKAKGLIGELLFLKTYIAPKTGWNHALNTWKGPTGTPQDFVVDDTVIEIKTTEAAKSNRITISNAEQLSTKQAQGFLFVQTLSSGVSHSANSITLNSLVENIEADILKAGGDTGFFRVYLNQLGYLKSEEEARRPYQVLNATFYALKEGFPRITPDSLPPGIIDVKYIIDLNSCQKYIETPHWINHE